MPQTNPLRRCAESQRRAKHILKQNKNKTGNESGPEISTKFQLLIKPKTMYIVFLLNT